MPQPYFSTPPSSLPSDQSIQLLASSASQQPTVPHGYFSHTNDAYDLEVRLLALDTVTDAGDRKGLLEINIQETSFMPYDYNKNEYYNKGKENGKRFASLINNLNFWDPDCNRGGSDIDYSNMKNLLKKLGYDTTPRKDRTSDQMLQDAIDFATLCSKTPNLHSCIIVVMTHGDLGKFMGVDGEYLD